MGYKDFRLDGTDIVTVKNAFGALPIQRRSKADAVKILRRALDGGMTYFDTARAYSDSEEKIGEAFSGVPRDRYYIASKTHATDPKTFWEELHTSLKNLRVDYIDVYQLHCADKCYKEGDGSGLYECLNEAQKQGKIRYKSITAHKIGVAEEVAKGGLYATLQFPFSYLATERDIALVKKCKQSGVGFIAMKGLSGGLITNSKAAFAFINKFDNVLPIWGVQKEEELEEWLSYINDPPAFTGEIAAFIENDKLGFAKDFCRGCGYCMPCPQGIIINQCTRMSQMVRRAPSEDWLSEYWQNEMRKTETCLNCGRCRSKCPYELNIPELLKKNHDDFFSILRGETKIYRPQR